MTISWFVIFMIVAIVFAALMMLKVPEGPRISYWGGVVFFVLLAILVHGYVHVPAG